MQGKSMLGLHRTYYEMLSGGIKGMWGMKRSGEMES